jgi:hypothetical protein
MDWYDKRCLQNEVQEKANYWEIIVVLILVLSIFIIIILMCKFLINEIDIA